MMNTSMIAGLCATVAVLMSGAASASDMPHAKLFRPQALPSLYITAAQAQAACPSDQVVWANWSARTEHLPTDKYYGRTKVGAYACEADATQSGFVLSN
jgi:hypothetical protein